MGEKTLGAVQPWEGGGGGRGWQCSRSFELFYLCLSLSSSPHTHTHFMMAHIHTSHWLERSATQEGHWDHSPWPAQMAQIETDSDNEQEGEEEEAVYVQKRHRPAAARQTAAPTQPRVKSAPTTRPSSVRSTSHRQLPMKGPLQRRRCRSKTTAETAHLHIDTILPLQLPPPNLCKAWWAGSADSLRRSDSITSFVSASSDGSWHGDSGDEDPNGQLEKALSQISTPSSSSTKKTTKDGLLLTTCDYEDEDDYYVQGLATQADIDDTEEEAIRLLAGPLMNNVASFFLDVKSLASSYYYYSDAQSSSSQAPSSHRQALTRSHSDCALYGSVSSPHELTLESNMIRRQRAVTAPSTFSAGHSNKQASSSPLHSLWQWFMPDIDDQLERELFGYPRPASRHRHDSIPSLYSDNSETEDDDSEEEGDRNLFTTDPMPEESALYALKGRQNPVTKTYKKSTLSLLDTTSAPSPLWDNRWEEQPYRRSWSSVLNLTSL